MLVFCLPGISTKIKSPKEGTITSEVNELAAVYHYKNGFILLLMYPIVEMLVNGFPGVTITFTLLLFGPCCQ